MTELSIEIPIPEQGQIVSVRQRRYLVIDIKKSRLPDTVLPSTRQIQHLVTLSSIEDDALGETIQVIWELEPGIQITDQVELPDVVGFDNPHRLDTFLDAVRWGAISQADPRALQAPFRSGIEIEDYQLNPLVRAVQMPRVSLLIADDVGLGKTVETGLVVQELIVRNRARTVLIVCPAGLQLHWRDQMRDKFGLDFRIVDSDAMREIRRRRGIHINPWTHYPRLITSIDFLKRERPMRLFRETLPGEGEPKYPRQFDVLVIDEAHNVAPSGGGRYAVDSLRTQAIRTIAPHFEHRIFLSATPHNGYKESFTALLELLDNQRFARGVEPNRQQLETVMVRRLKTDLIDEWGNLRFPKRQLEVIEVDYTEAERQVHRWLQAYTNSREQNADGDSERFATEFVLKLLKKRLFSSPEAFRTTLEKHIKTLTQVTEKAERRATKRYSILRRQLAQVDEDYGDDEAYETASDEAVDTATRTFREPNPEEMDLLRRMRDWAEDASRRWDSKTEALVSWLEGVCHSDGQWNNERVIIFTEYRTTQQWLHGVLTTAGLGGEDRLALIYGGMDKDEREAIKAAFQAKPDENNRLRILLATDAASEGIDLQNHCHRLIHVEIPWNPNRLEQRNGRIDRHGQTKNPQIFHFVSAGYEERSADMYASLRPGDLDGDLEFLMRAALKVDQIREDLGKVGPVIAAQVEQAMTGKISRLDTARAEAEAGAVRRILRFERDIRQQIERHMEQFYETKHELHISDESIKAVVDTALEIADQPALYPANGFDHAYYLPHLSRGWEVTTEGLEHPHTKEIRPVVFDYEHADGRDDVVLAHLNHRLVQMATRLLRAQIWAPEAERGLYRVTATTVPNHVLDGPAVVAHARLVVIGGGSHRLHEEIIASGGFITPGNRASFRRMNVGETQSALDAATKQPVSEQIQQNLIDLWDDVKGNLQLALQRRMEDKLDTIKGNLKERETKERADIEAILRELEQTIRRELTEPEYQQARQLELPLDFNDDERDQLVRNVQALEARLQQIPLEIEAEQEEISKRFADLEPRLFPVAVTFLIPERMNR